MPGMGVGAEGQQLNSFQGLSLNAEDDVTRRHFLVAPQSPTLVATQSESAIGTLAPQLTLRPRPSLLFSHLEHSTYNEATVSSSSSCECGQWNGTSLDGSSGEGDVCPVCGGSLTNQNSDEDIVTSFNSLSVSPNSDNSFCSSNAQRVSPLSTVAASSGSHMSCRQQAASYGGGAMYFDDTTVDDLAGYLDEIMFLPKPMSEMAELMYT